MMDFRMTPQSLYNRVTNHTERVVCYVGLRSKIDAHVISSVP